MWTSFNSIELKLCTLLYSYILNQSVVEKLGNIDENGSGHFDFSGVSDMIKV